MGEVRNTFICKEKERCFVGRCPGFTPVLLKEYIKLIICENMRIFVPKGSSKNDS